MTGGEIARALLAGVVAGFAGGLFGVGGGILLVPFLTGFFALSQHQAHGTSLAVIGATAISALVVYGLHGNVAWTTAAVIAASSVFGAQLGARWATGVSDGRLTRAFAGLLFLVAVRLMWRTPDAATEPVFHGAAAIVFELVLGLAIGLLSGFMGVGGGLLAVPALTLFMGASQQLAQGTSLAVILVTAPFGAWVHARKGNVVLRLVPAMAIGGAIGAPFAGALAQRLPHELLVRGFAIFLFVNAVSTWVRADRADRALRAKAAMG